MGNPCIVHGWEKQGFSLTGVLYTVRILKATSFIIIGAKPHQRQCTVPFGSQTNIMASNIAFYISEN